MEEIASKCARMSVTDMSVLNYVVSTIYVNHKLKIWESHLSQAGEIKSLHEVSCDHYSRKVARGDMTASFAQVGD